ncbi:hypothetical protein D3C78_1483770 [compost metagenome]
MKAVSFMPFSCSGRASSWNTMAPCGKLTVWQCRPIGRRPVCSTREMNSGMPSMSTFSGRLPARPMMIAVSVW